MYRKIAKGKGRWFLTWTERRSQWRRVTCSRWESRNNDRTLKVKQWIFAKIDNFFLAAGPGSCAEAYMSDIRHKVVGWLHGIGRLSWDQERKFSETRGLQKFVCVPGRLCMILHAKIFEVNMYAFKERYLLESQSTKTGACARNSTSFHPRLSGRISFVARPDAYTSTSSRPGICGSTRNPTDMWRRRSPDLWSHFRMASAWYSTCIRKNVIWKSISISCRFPKNRKFGEIVEIAGKFQVTAANFLEGSKLFNFFLNFPTWNLYLRDYIVLSTSAYAHLECHAFFERTVTSEWTSSSCETKFI